MWGRTLMGGLIGIGAGLALRHTAQIWPVALMGALALSTFLLYARELRYADEASHGWLGSGGPLFQWVRIWLPLGRIVAPAIFFSILSHRILMSMPPTPVRALGFLALAVLSSTLVWHCHRMERLVALAAVAGLALMLGWRTPAHLTVPLALLGGILWVLTHPDADPDVVQRTGWKPFLGSSLGLIGGVVVALVVRLAAGFTPVEGLWLCLLGWVWFYQTTRRSNRRQAILALVGLAQTLAPMLILGCEAVAWLLGQGAAAYLLWAWLRRARPYMYRPWGRWMYVVSHAGLLAAGGLLIWAASVNELAPLAGIAAWFLIPPLIDAYRAGRYPFRRVALPDPRTLAD